MLSIVTGGAGFLGSHLVDALLQAGHEVVAIDNLSTGKLANLEAASNDKRFAFLFLDLATQAPETVLGVIRECTGGREVNFVFHLASPASPDAYSQNQWATLAVNSIGTMAMIDFALEAKATFVFASTSEIYGDPLVHPQPESYFGNVDPIGPRSCYDEGKRFGEAAVAAGVRERSLDARIVRFFNCYGPRMELGDGRLIPAFLSAAIDDNPLPIQGTGTQTRSLTFVDDAISLLLAVADAPRSALDPVNIGNDEELSVLDIAKTFCRVTGIDYRVEHETGRLGDPQRRKPVLDVARSLDWSPTTSLSSGIRITYDWFLAHRALYV